MKQICISFLAMMFGVLFLCNQSVAGSFAGNVLDYGKDPPNNGLSGAIVQLKPTGSRKAKECITNYSGAFSMDAEDGDYSLIVVKVGYIPHPYERRISLKGRMAFEDIRLIKANADPNYYAMVATFIANKVKSVPWNNKKQVIESEWNYLSGINPPPAAKVFVAKELNAEAKNLGTAMPDFKPYLSVTPQNVYKLENLFDKAITARSGIPNKNFVQNMGLNDQIVVDIVSYKLEGNSYTSGDRAVFQHKFITEWSDTIKKSPDVWSKVVNFDKVE